MDAPQGVNRIMIPTNLKMDENEVYIIEDSQDEDCLNGKEHSLSQQTSIPEKQSYNMTCCGETFHSYNSMKVHEKSKHTCPVCSKDTKNVLRHIREAHGENLILKDFFWICCGLFYNDFILFSEHKLQEHKIDELKCSVCTRIPLFSSVLETQNHYINVHCKPMALYKCFRCNYAFGVKSSFFEHEKHCNETTTLCRQIVESVVDLALPRIKTYHNKRLMAVAGHESSRPFTTSDGPHEFKFICCEEVFTSFVDFNVHKFVKHNIEHLVCGLCDLEEKKTIFLYRHYLKLHFYGHKVAIDNTKPKKESTLEETTNPTAGSAVEKKGNVLIIKDKCSSDKDCSTTFNAVQCTAQQEGILCQCLTCSRLLSALQASNKVDNNARMKPYVCKVCSLRFIYESRLKRHVKTHLGYKDFPCDICGGSFTKKTSLNKHKLYKHSSNPFKVTCNTCLNVFSCESALKKHIRNVHLRQVTSFRVECSYCASTFSQTKSLNRHLNEYHLRHNEYICYHCDRIFYDKGILTSHIKSAHLPPETVTCEICGFVATNKTILHNHRNRNHSQHRFGCEICGKTFSNKKGLELHRVGHFDEKPYVCQTCGKCFKRESNLVQHQYTHSDLRPHSCTMCGQTFRLRTHLKQHMTVHGTLKNHTCFVCSMTFARKGELNLHLSDHGS